MKSITILGILFSLSTGAIAAVDPVENIIEQVKTLIHAQKLNRAYNLLFPVADDYAGIAKFDYIYGMLLLKLNKTTSATLVLERALIMQPDDLAIQKALMQAYIKSKDFASAKQLAFKIKQHPEFKPDKTFENIQDEVADYNISGFLGASIGYDDNLTTGPNENYITLPKYPELDKLFVGTNLEQDQDFFSSVSGNLNLMLPLTKDFGITTGLYGNRRINNQRHDEDATVFSYWLGSYYKWQQHKFGLNLRQQIIWLSDEHYQDQYELAGEWSYNFTPNSMLSLYTDAKLTRYVNSKNLNANGYTVGSVFYQQFNSWLKPLLSAEIYGGEDKISNPEFQYLGYANFGSRLSSRFVFSPDDMLFINTEFQYRHYKADNPFFLIARDDQRYSVTGRYVHYFLDKQLSVALQGTWQLNQSVIELYDYRRNFVTLGLQWNF